MSTFVPDVGPTGLSFNQFLIDADEPAIFHTGPRATFTSVSEAIASVMPLERLRWITLGHLEADDCGAMNRFLAAFDVLKSVDGRRPMVIGPGTTADDETASRAELGWLNERRLGVQRYQGVPPWEWHPADELLYVLDGGVALRSWRTARCLRRPYRPAPCAWFRADAGTVL